MSTANTLRQRGPNKGEDDQSLWQEYQGDYDGGNVLEDNENQCGPYDLGGSTISDRLNIKFQPRKRLEFDWRPPVTSSGDTNQHPIMARTQLINNESYSIKFRLESSAPERYQPVPQSGVVAPGEAVELKFEIVADCDDANVLEADRVVVLMAPADKEDQPDGKTVKVDALEDWTPVDTHTLCPVFTQAAMTRLFNVVTEKRQNDRIWARRIKLINWFLVGFFFVSVMIISIMMSSRKRCYVEHVEAVITNVTGQVQGGDTIGAPPVATI